MVSKEVLDQIMKEMDDAVLVNLAKDRTPRVPQAVHDQIDREMDEAFDRNLKRDLDERAAAKK